MPNRNKQRSYESEVALNRVAEGFGFTAKRAWGSNGESLGLAKEVDNLIDGETWQVKRKKTAPAYLLDMIKLARRGVVDAIAFYFDRQGVWVFLPAEKYFALRREAEDLRRLAGTAGRSTADDDPGRRLSDQGVPGE